MFKEQQYKTFFLLGSISDLCMRDVRWVTVCELGYLVLWHVFVLSYLYSASAPKVVPLNV